MVANKGEIRGNSMRERRKYIRIKAPIGIAYKLLGKGLPPKKSVARNFRDAGVRFFVHEKLAEGATLQLYIENPFDTMPIFATGQIIWVKDLRPKEGRKIYDVGLKLSKMDTFNKKRLNQLDRHFLECR